MARYRVLHLVGSPTSTFFVDLSLVYARGCLASLAVPADYEHLIAFVTPDGRWRFPRALDQRDIDSAEGMSFAAAIDVLAHTRIDIALPQMFCLAGMTDYRALLETLHIPYLGNRPLQMALAADKAKTRAVVAAAGVAIPDGELVRQGEPSRLAPPVVVKPNDADNSDGITLVRSVQAYAPALQTAFSFSREVLVERYIELGREMRCGVIERNGMLATLPLEEYYVDTIERPVRRREDKLKAGDDGLALAAKAATQSWIVAVDDPICKQVWNVAKRCHRALGCRQYSLFDFRIDPQGQPWFLEAGLYCSFSPQSVLATMVASQGKTIQVFFQDMVEEVLRVKP